MTTNTRSSCQFMKALTVLANVGAVASWGAFLYSLASGGPTVLTMLVALVVSFGVGMLHLAGLAPTTDHMLPSTKQGS